MVHSRKLICSFDSLFVLISVFVLPANGRSVNENQNQILAFNQIIEPTINPAKICAEYPELNEQQQSICSRYPHATASAMQGLTLALHECQRQFGNNRWNCSNLNTTIFNYHPFMLKGYKESAFVHSIAAAGVLHQIARACSIGKIQSCGCELAGSQFEWNGCSHDLGFGAKYSRKFLQYKEDNLASLLQAHNMKIGRKAVIDKKIEKCKCHGMSSSCEVKTCWLSTPDFRVVGDQLKAAYNASIKVDQSNVVAGRADLRSFEPAEPEEDNFDFRDSESEDINLKRRMIYNEKSPNYCNTVQEVGVAGTSGRVCNKTSTGTDGCNTMCCGRGYFTVQVRIVEKCNCEFFWCCYVVCQRCEREEWVTICR